MYRGLASSVLGFKKIALLLKIITCQCYSDNKTVLSQRAGFVRCYLFSFTLLSIIKLVHFYYKLGVTSTGGDHYDQYISLAT